MELLIFAFYTTQKMAKERLTENIAEQTPAGGVLVGKRSGQTMIHNKGSLSGYLVGKTHAKGGIKAVNKATGQPLEMQGGEVVITAPAVSDQTKREFEGKMMTNREILSEINSRGGGVSFANGGDIPAKLKYTGASYNYGGKTMSDHDIYMHINGGHLAKGKTLKQIAKMHDVELLDIEKQVKMGMKAESEHTSSKREQLKIVKDHLFENPKYYTLLKKAGLKKGGIVKKEDLAKDADKGDTPARDLNNYNDLMDLQADGAVGGDNGLAMAKGGDLSELDKHFDLGGDISMPAVAYVKISKTGDSLSFLQGIRYDSYIDFAEAIDDAFKKIKDTVARSYVNLEVFDEQGATLTKVATEISYQKNTIKNFNPKTGNYKNLEKSLAHSRPVSFKKFYWDNWLQSKVLPKAGFTNSASPKITNLTYTKIEIGDNPELSKAVQEKAFELGWHWETNPTTVQSVNAKYLHFWSDKTILAHSDKATFEQSGQTLIQASDLLDSVPTTSGQTSANKSIFSEPIPDAIPNFSGIAKDLPTAILVLLTKRADEQGIDPSKLDFTRRIISILDFKNTSEGFRFWDETAKGNFLQFKQKYGDKGEKVIDAVKQALNTSTSKPKITDLTNTKIWIGDNPELSKAVQEKAFELGWNWKYNTNPLEIRMTDEKSLFFQNDNAIGFSSYEDYFKEEKNFREIFALDLFDAVPTNLTQSSANTSTSKPKITDLTNTKIWIGDNPELLKAVQEKAFELGWTWNTQNPKTIIDTVQALVFDKQENITHRGFRNGNQGKAYFDLLTEKEIFASDLLDSAPAISGQQSVSQPQKADVPLTPEQELAKKFVADDFQLRKNDLLGNATKLEEARKDLESLSKLLPSFQASKFAVERASILKEMAKLNKKITYEGFIRSNEEASKGDDLFTPQGLLDYYYTQTTQNPTAELEPACELPTPNGAKSKLPMGAYLNIRTPQFKKWFGDWEKAYETGNYVNCSKMIDEETKEPKIYYHGVRKYVPNFGQMSNMGVGVVRPYGSFEPPSFPASYFADNESYANFYGGIAENLPTPSPDYKPFIYKVFLSVKNPISLLPLDFELSYKDLMDYVFVAYGVRLKVNNALLSQLDNDIDKKHPIWIYIRRDIGLIETLKEYGYDALFQTGDIPVFDKNGEVVSDRNKFIKDTEYLTFYPNQVKSATVKKSFYFDFFNDIRFKKGGYVRI